MIAAGKSNGVCWGNISDGLPLYVAGPVPCDERHTVPYTSPWGQSSHPPPEQREEEATTYEACQSYTLSGYKYENLGMIDGMMHPVVRQPWGKTVEVCGDEAATPEEARANLQQLIAGMNGTTGIARDNCTFIDNCSAREKGDVEVKEKTPLWNTVLSFIRRFGEDAAEIPAYGGGSSRPMLK